MAVGVLVGGLVVAILGMTFTATREATGIIRGVQAVADSSGKIMMGAALLADRLQRVDPVVARELNELLPGLDIEDEGGKVSVPLTAYCLPQVMGQFGVSNVSDRITDMMEAFGLADEQFAAAGYPLILPAQPKAGYWVECPEALADFWGCSTSELKEMRRWFTACPTFGVNVNTADPRCVVGVVKWQRQAGAGWADRVAKGEVSPFSLSPSYTPGVSVTFKTFILPMPSHDPLVFYPDPITLYPYRPSEILNANSLVPSLFPISPDSPYNPLWQLVQVARKTPGNVKFDLVDWSIRKVRYHDGTKETFIQTYLKPYAPSPNAWMKGTAVGNPQDIVGGRPYAVNELTQPLGVFWYTPESYFMPLSPSGIGEFKRLNPNDDYPPPVDLNVGLSAAAFTGWISLQGPGPYRSASEWFTLIARNDSLLSRSEVRWTLRIYPDEPPRVVSSSVE